MVSRVIVAAMFLGTALTTFPAYATPATPPTRETASAQAQPDAPLAQPATIPPGTAFLQPEQIQDPSDASGIDKIDLNYIKGYAIDTGKIVTAPLRWQGNDWLKVGLVLGGTAALFLVDEEVKKFAQKNQNSVGSRFADLGNFIGEPMYIFPAVGASYLYGHFADDSKVRRVSLLSLESLSITAALTMGLKTVAGRHRPLTGDLPMNWHGPTNNGDWASFSSGHTSNAFAVATVVANEYQDTPYVAPVAYGLATLTALARIYDNEHWVSDTFFGAALGHFVSKAVLSYHKEDKKSLGKRLSILPQVGKEMTGVTVSYQF